MLVNPKMHRLTPSMPAYFPEKGLPQPSYFPENICP